jgi:hypothetical protein
MKLTVSKLNGETMLFTVSPNENVLKLNERIMETQGIPIAAQRLIFQSNYIEGEKKL